MATVLRQPPLPPAAAAAKVPKEKVAAWATGKPITTVTAATTATTTVARAAATSAASSSALLFCPIPVKARVTAEPAAKPGDGKMKKNGLMGAATTPEDDIVDVENVQRWASAPVPRPRN